MKNLASLLLLALPLTLGCGGDDGSSGVGGTPGTGGAGGAGQVFSANPPLVLAEDERPAMVAIPSDYDPETSYPLLILLHGAGAWGELQANFFRMFDVIDDKQFVFVYPDGINNVWNATEACCDPTGEVDDVGYISGLIEEAQAVYNIDAELWTLLPLECAAALCNPHIPVFTEVWADVTTDWLFRHSR